MLSNIHVIAGHDKCWGSRGGSGCRGTELTLACSPRVGGTELNWGMLSWAGGSKRWLQGQELPCLYGVVVTGPAHHLSCSCHPRGFGDALT